jgi:chorismate synthase
MVRCPDPAAAGRMIDLISQTKEEKNSIGGIVSCVCRHVPVGLGEPVFDKLEASLAQAMLSIPATKGFELGAGFSGTRMNGSAHNDPFVKKGDRLGTVTNHSGGVQGGISNGEPIFFRVAFKPPATIGQPQKTVDFNGREVVLEAKGRHDPCVVPRAVPIVETMTALVLADLVLRQNRFNVAGGAN